MCGKVPSIGWVYVCRQDELIQAKFLNFATEPFDELSPANNGDDFFEAHAKIAESIGMSASVIKQMRAGEYNADQVEILLQQRRQVIELIRRSEGTSKTSSSKSSTSQAPPENVIASVGAIAAPAVQQIGAPSMPMSPAGTHPGSCSQGKVSSSGQN